MTEETSNITKYSTLEKFIKDHTDQRISKEAIEFLLKETDKIYTLLVKEASEYSKKDNRTTVLDRDFEKALKVVFESEGAGEPDAVYKKIDDLSVDNLAHLIKIITKVLKEQ